MQDEVLSNIQRFSARKWDGISEISTKYPSMKSSWGSKYFSTQRGVQCPLPRVVLYYRSLISATYWQSSEKKNLNKTVEDMLRLNRDPNRGEGMALEAEAETESGEDEAKEDEISINWNEVCQITKFVKVFFHPFLFSH